MAWLIPMRAASLTVMLVLPSVIAAGQDSVYSTNRGDFPRLAPRGSAAIVDGVARTDLSATDRPADPVEAPSTIAPIITVVSSLAIVLALFCGLVWVSRKFGGRAGSSKPLPASVIRPIGHAMLDPRTKVLLVQCGRRVLVLAQTATGVTPLSEVTSPDEVRELMAMCSAESKAAFETTLRQLESEPIQRGFASPPPKSLFTTA